MPYHSVRVLNGMIRLLVMHLGANINIPAHNTAFGKAQSQWWNPKGKAEGGKAYAPIVREDLVATAKPGSHETGNICIAFREIL